MSTNLRSLAPQDRPREKLEKSGAASLGDNELLALVIGHGTSGRSALAVANEMLSVAGGTHGLTRASRARLAQVTGVGVAIACRVQAAIELGRRTLYLSPPARQQFVRPQDVALFLLPRFGACPVEQFGVMMLDTRRRLIRVHVISVGSLDAASAHPREVFREAAIAGAAAVVVFHNHPSGDPTPSVDDAILTRRLMAAGDIVGITLEDHVILADTRYCSMRESEVVKWPG
jgi:DNA repair protein RadC